MYQTDRQPGAWPAIERPQEVHLHLHGLTAEDIAAIIARQPPGRM